MYKPEDILPYMRPPRWYLWPGWFRTALHCVRLSNAPHQVRPQNCFESSLHVLILPTTLQSIRSGCIRYERYVSQAPDLSQCDSPTLWWDACSYNPCCDPVSVKISFNPLSCCWFSILLCSIGTYVHDLLSASRTACDTQTARMVRWWWLQVDRHVVDWRKVEAWIDLRYRQSRFANKWRVQRVWEWQCRGTDHDDVFWWKMVDVSTRAARVR